MKILEPGHMFEWAVATGYLHKMICLNCVYQKFVENVVVHESWMLNGIWNVFNWENLFELDPNWT